MPWSECRCHRVEDAVSEAPSQSSSVGPYHYLEARSNLEYHPPSSPMHTLTDILKNDAVRKYRAHTTTDRTFDCRPNGKNHDTPKGTKSKSNVHDITVSHSVSLRCMLLFVDLRPL